MKNQIGFKLCPYALIQYSWIDFGNKQGYSECGAVGSPIVIAFSPAKSYVTIDIMAVYINSLSVSLPTTFQNYDSALITNGDKAWSYLDSCCSSKFFISKISG